MNCNLGRHFHVLHFHALLLGPSFSRPAFSAPPNKHVHTLRLAWCDKKSDTIGFALTSTNCLSNFKRDASRTVLRQLCIGLYTSSVTNLCTLLSARQHLHCRPLFVCRNLPNVASVSSPFFPQSPLSPLRMPACVPTAHGHLGTVRIPGCS